MKIFSRSQFFKDTSVLTLGIFLAQILNFVIYPILGRLYTPNDFALLANITSICSILTVICTGRYEMSIILCKSKKDAINVFVLSILLSILVLLITGIIFVFCGDYIGALLHNNSVVPFLYLALASSLSIIVFNCYNEWCVRDKLFKTLSINKINNSGAIAICKLICGYPIRICNGLIWGDFIGRGLSAIGCIVRLNKTCPNFTENISISAIKQNAVRFKEFPKYILPGQLLNSLSVAAPVFLISYYYGSEITGYYSMALTLLILPVSIVSNAVKDVFRQKITYEINCGKNCRPLIIRLLIPLSIACILGACLLYPFLPFLFNFFLGSTWKPAGIYSQIMLFMAVTEFCAMSLNGVLLAVEQLKVVFWWQVIFLILTILPLFFAGEIGLNIKESLILFSYCRASCYMLYIVLTFIYLPKHKLT